MKILSQLDEELSEMNRRLTVLQNGKETAIPAVPAFSGPYYRWEDLKAHLVRISEDKSDPV